jgi:hypothetical protein
MRGVAKAFTARLKRCPVRAGSGPGVALPLSDDPMFRAAGLPGLDRHVMFRGSLAFTLAMDHLILGE